jgi:M6 family metalloprotease-like protein
MSRNMSYYGSFDDNNAPEMIIEACDSAHALYGVDFTQYDNDNDGFVDFVYVIYAGYGEADGAPSTTIWPHQWNLYDYGGITHRIDGKILNRYACGNELSYFSNIYDGIGTICHEFSHVLGLPDLYSTDQSSTHKTMGAWDVMDYGPYNNDGNTPPSYSAYERFYMGWITPRVLNEPENVTLHPLNESQEALLLCDGNKHNLVGWNPNPATFYLLEVRRLIGWDEYLPGQGMLLTKIQFSYNKWSNNIVNNNANSQGVDLIESDGKSTGSGTSSLGKAGDAFPNGKKYWFGYDDHEIENIARKANGVITFQYRGGAAEGIEDVPSDQVQSTKVIRDGQILILRDGKTYNLLGTPID